MQSPFASVSDKSTACAQLPTKLKAPSWIGAYQLYIFTDGCCKGNNTKNGGRKAGSGILVLTPQCVQQLHQIFHDKSIYDIQSLRKQILNRYEPLFHNARSFAIELPHESADGVVVSNNRAEMHALQCVLSWLHIHKRNIRTKIFSDSTYTIDAYNALEKWNQKGFEEYKNPDYLAQLYAMKPLVQSHVDLEYVPAHLKECQCNKDFATWFAWFGNDFADRLSNIGAKAQHDINYAVTSKTKYKRKHRDKQNNKNSKGVKRKIDKIADNKLEK